MYSTIPLIYDGTFFLYTELLYGKINLKNSVICK